MILTYRGNKNVHTNECIQNQNSLNKEWKKVDEIA